MTLSSLVVAILILGLTLFIFNHLVPNAALGYYGGIVVAVILLLFLLNRFGGLTF